MWGTQCHWRRWAKMFRPWWWCGPRAFRGMPPPPRQVFFIGQTEEELDLLIETCRDCMRALLLAVSASISWHPAGSITCVRLHVQRWWGLARRTSRTRNRETLRCINMAIDKTTQLSTTLVRE